ncbi:hypothetical protein [Enterobacter roggenkampii]|uniref:hypothetical protein n=1 Tax=Enterobacter roggenkampii TaxID=1812935 RepID=UPI000BA8C62B|nr:hypothetical protein [Enterobacter roggenkampii]PAO24645.1 hypothetical protein CIW56_01585 [Enterobacter roggenkampii]
MTTKQNIKALANTARECASLANSVSGTIKWIVTHWNLCCQQSGLEGFTTEACYTRRAALAAEMLRMAEQLDRLAEGCHPITGQTADDAHAEALEMNEVVDYVERTKNMTAQEWIDESNAVIAAAAASAEEAYNDFERNLLGVEQAHAEALEMNAERSAKLANEVMFCDDHRSLFNKCDPYVRGLMIADAHTEALRANEMLDTSALVVLNNRDAWKSASATVKKLAVALAQDDAQEENYRFNWLHNRWCLFHSSSRQQQQEIIGVAWEQARQTIEAEEEYNSQRQWKLEAIWKHTHRDYKGESDGVRSILVCRNGTISVPLEGLTDKEIEQRSSMWQRNK